MSSMMKTAYNIHRAVFKIQRKEYLTEMIIYCACLPDISYNPCVDRPKILALIIVAFLHIYEDHFGL